MLFRTFQIFHRAFSPRFNRYRFKNPSPRLRELQSTTARLLWRRLGATEVPSGAMALCAVEDAASAVFEFLRRLGFHYKDILVEAGVREHFLRVNFLLIDLDRKLEGTTHIDLQPIYRAIGQSHNSYSLEEPRQLADNLNDLIEAQMSLDHADGVPATFTSTLKTAIAAALVDYGERDDEDVANLVSQVRKIMRGRDYLRDLDGFLVAIKQAGIPHEELLEARSMLNEPGGSTIADWVLQAEALLDHAEVLLGTSTPSKPLKPDYYTILGVQRDASLEQINKAHRLLAFQYHPDRKRTTAEKIAGDEKLKEINEAYETLSDTAKRKKYDEGPGL